MITRCYYQYYYSAGCRNTRAPPDLTPGRRCIDSLRVSAPVWCSDTFSCKHVKQAPMWRWIMQEAAEEVFIWEDLNQPTFIFTTVLVRGMITWWGDGPAHTTAHKHQQRERFPSNRRRPSRLFPVLIWISSHNKRKTNIFGVSKTFPYSLCSFRGTKSSSVDAECKYSLLLQQVFRHHVTHSDELQTRRWVRPGSRRSGGSSEDFSSQNTLSPPYYQAPWGSQDHRWPLLQEAGVQTAALTCNRTIICHI